MKRETIEKSLKDAGVPDDKIKDLVDGIMAENGKDIEAEKAKTTAKDGELVAANQTIKDLQDTVKKFDGKDPVKLQADLEDLRKKYDADITAEKEKASSITKTYALKEALAASGVLDPDYLIYKTGGIEKFAFSDDKPIGVEDVIKPYKDSSPHLFKTEDGGEGGSGSGPSIIVNSGGEHGKGGGADYDKMSDAEYYSAILKKDK